VGHTVCVLGDGSDVLLPSTSHPLAVLEHPHLVSHSSQSQVTKRLFKPKVSQW
jgi:hypothetical protein